MSTPAQHPPSQVTFPRYDLTGRELEMLELASRDMSNKAIAKAQQTTEQVIKNRWHREVFRKMKVSNRAAAVAKALREGLIK